MHPCGHHVLCRPLRYISFSCSPAFSIRNLIHPKESWELPGSYPRGLCTLVFCHDLVLCVRLLLISRGNTAFPPETAVPSPSHPVPFPSLAPVTIHEVGSAHAYSDSHNSVIILIQWNLIITVNRHFVNCPFRLILVAQPRFSGLGSGLGPRIRVRDWNYG